MWTVALLVIAMATLPQDAERRLVPLGLDERVPAPADNALTPAKTELGRMLFFDPALSGDGSVACASCHVPARAFTDGEKVAKGAGGRVGRRNTPSLANRVYGSTFGRSGAASSIEEQVLRAFRDPQEMNLPLLDLAARVRSSDRYREGFEAAFGGAPTVDRIARALATFVRGLYSADSPFDRFDHGDRGALSPAARAGLEVFRGRGRCIRCHSGATFTDETFHNTGVAWRDGAFTDPGRYEVTGRLDELGAFKTPSLRDVALTAPYMHDGSLATLEDVIDFYDRGGRPNAYLDPKIRPLRLEPEEKRALIEFLRSLTGTQPGGAAARPGTQAFTR